MPPTWSLYSHRAFLPQALEKVLVWPVILPLTMAVHAPEIRETCRNGLIVLKLPTNWLDLLCRAWGFELLQCLRKVAADHYATNIIRGLF